MAFLIVSYLLYINEGFAGGVSEISHVSIANHLVQNNSVLFIFSKYIVTENFLQVVT